MWEQAKALQEGAEIVVCTPVRDMPPSSSPAYDLHFCLHQQTDHFLSARCEGPSDRPRQEEGHVPAEGDLPGV